MEALGGGNGGLWGWNWQPRKPKPSDSQSRRSKFDSMEANQGAGYRFPVKQAATAASLVLTGDTIAQVRDRWRKRGDSFKRHPFFDSAESHKDVLLDHDWLRALRMSSYGFLLYGPGSYAWYQYLDCCMPKQTVQNIMLKVLLNQIVVGPCVIAVIFAWNDLWQGKLSQLPSKYQKDALPTLLYGFRFWVPVTVLNFWVVPLQARVAFMSTGSIFWNFYLSAIMSK